MRTRLSVAAAPIHTIVALVMSLCATLAVVGILASAATGATPIKLVHPTGGGIAKAGDPAVIVLVWEADAGKPTYGFCEGTDFEGHVVGPNSTNTSWKIAGSKKDVAKKYCESGGHQTAGGLEINSVTVKGSHGAWSSVISVKTAIELADGCKYELKKATFTRHPFGELEPYGENEPIPLQKNVAQPPGCALVAEGSAVFEVRDPRSEPRDYLVEPL
jgi:hypothetical protein